MIYRFVYLTVFLLTELDFVINVRVSQMYFGINFVCTFCSCKHRENSEQIIISEQSKNYLNVNF